MDFGTDFTINVLWAALLGYAFGSIPFGLILAKMAGKGDIRQQGSGNIGATNVFRCVGKGLGITTLVLDALKGFAPAFILPIVFKNDLSLVQAQALGVTGACGAKL